MNQTRSLTLESSNLIIPPIYPEPVIACPDGSMPRETEREKRVRQGAIDVWTEGSMAGRTAGGVPLAPLIGGAMSAVLGAIKADVNYQNENKDKDKDEQEEKCPPTVA